MGADSQEPDPDSNPVPTPAVSEPNSSYHFTSKELYHLAIYRAACRYNFFNDSSGVEDYAHDPSFSFDFLKVEDTQTTSNTSDNKYPFTSRERKELEKRRAAVVGGYYKDDMPSKSTE